MIDTERNTNKMVMFPKTVISELDEYARLRGNSFSATVRDLVRRGLEEERKRQRQLEEVAS